MSASALSSGDRRVLRASIIVALGAPLAVILPPLIWIRQSPFAGWTYGRSYQPIELLGFTFTVLMTIAGLVALRRSRDELADWVPVVGFMAAGFMAAMWIVELSGRSFDYSCFENAANFLRHGDNPYSRVLGTAYVYPPLFVQVMAAVETAIGHLAPSVGFAPDRVAPDFLSDALFYVYQATQLWLLLAAFPLLYFLLRNSHVDEMAAVILVLLAFLVDVPLIRTIKHQQLNVLMLDLSLVALLNRSRPVIAGLAIALGTHIKLYPVLLLVPFVWTGAWAAVGAWAIGMALPFLIPGSVTHWGHFLAGLSTLDETAFRNAGFYSLTYNVLALSGASTWLAVRAAHTIAFTASTAVTIWMLVRLRRRDRRDPTTWLLNGADWLALSLFLSPRAWEHVYVFAIPLAFGAFITTPPERRRWLVAAAMAVFAVPVFDVFLLSDHRLVGLFALLVLTGTNAHRAGIRRANAQTEAVGARE